MLMPHKQLIGLVVRTQARKKIGKIIGLVVDTESQSIMQYNVKRSLFGGDVLLINRSQVISITESSMIVDELSLKAKDEKPLVVPVKKDQAPGLASSNEAV